MYCKGGMFLLVILLVLPIVISQGAFECSDGSSFGECNDKQELCGFENNLIFKNSVNLIENTNYIFFGETNENNCKLNFNNETINLFNTGSRVVGDFKLANNYNGELNSTCGNIQTKLNKKYLGEVKNEFSLRYDFGYCGVPQEFIDYAQRYLVTDKDGKEELREEIREVFGIQSGFFGGATGNVVIDGREACTDFDSSGLVDYDDFFIFVDNFGLNVGDDNFDNKFDFDLNGIVDFDDFFIFADDFDKEVECGYLSVRPLIVDEILSIISPMNLKIKSVDTDELIGNIEGGFVLNSNENYQFPIESEIYLEQSNEHFIKEDFLTMEFVSNGEVKIIDIFLPRCILQICVTVRGLESQLHIAEDGTTYWKFKPAIDGYVETNNPTLEQALDNNDIALESRFIEDYERIRPLTARSLGIIRLIDHDYFEIDEDSPWINVFFGEEDQPVRFNIINPQEFDSFQPTNDILLYRYFLQDPMSLSVRRGGVTESNGDVKLEIEKLDGTKTIIPLYYPSMNIDDVFYYLDNPPDYKIEGSRIGVANEVYFATDGSSYWRQNPELNLFNPTFEQAVRNGHLALSASGESSNLYPYININRFPNIILKDSLFTLPTTIVTNIDIENIEIQILDNERNIIKSILTDTSISTNGEIFNDEVSFLINSEDLDNGEYNLNLILSVSGGIRKEQFMGETFLVIGEESCVSLNGEGDRSKNNVLNFVFAGFNFDDNSEFVNWIERYKNDLMIHEPMNSNQERFQFYYVDVTKSIINPKLGLGERGREMEDYIEQIVDICNLPNEHIIGIGNWHFRPNAIWDWGFYIPTSGFEGIGETESVTFPHEFGHSFGLMYDEYKQNFISGRLPPDERFYRNCDGNRNYGEACSTWCTETMSVEQVKAIDCESITSSRECRSSSFCLWLYDCPADELFCVSGGINLVGKTGCVNTVEICTEYETEEECKNAKDGALSGSFCKWLGRDNNWFKSSCLSRAYDPNYNIGIECDEGFGCYMECGGSNWFKSTPRSIMSGWALEPFNTFNLKHIEILCDRIFEITGGYNGICEEVYSSTI